MQQVGHRRLHRLVVFRKRPVHELPGNEETRNSFWKHDEATQLLGRMAIGPVIGNVTDPPFSVPANSGTLRIPRVSVGICRATVIKYSAIGRPAKSPLVKEPELTGIFGTSPLHLIAGLGKGTCVKPVATQCRSICSKFSE